MLARLRDIDLDALSPREALEPACRLRKRVECQHLAPQRFASP
jgi:hypothetical protein